MPKVGGRRKKARSHKETDAELEKQLPKIFVVKRGQTPAELTEVVHDLRKCFYPNTAMKLEDSTKIDIKTYLKTAKFYNVTHLVALQSNKEKNFMRILKLGGGEMVFRIVNYCRMKDVIHNGGQQFSFGFKDPLTVLNGFGVNSQTKMIGRSLREMFPPINPEKIKIQRLKRVVVFDYNANKKMIYFRHYKIIIQEGGLDKSFSKLIQQKSVDLSHFSSIGEYLSTLTGQQNQEETGQNQQKVKLVEMGPRLKLKFISYKEKEGKQHDQQEEQIQEGHPEGQQVQQ